MRKKISIALLAFSLAMICANFIVRRVGRLLPPPQQEIEEEEKDFIPFVPVKQKNEDELVIDSYLLIFIFFTYSVQAILTNEDIEIFILFDISFIC